MIKEWVDVLHKVMNRKVFLLNETFWLARITYTPKGSLFNKLPGHLRYNDS